VKCQPFHYVYKLNLEDLRISSGKGFAMSNLELNLPAKYPVGFDTEGKTYYALCDGKWTTIVSDDLFAKQDGQCVLVKATATNLSLPPEFESSRVQDEEVPIPVTHIGFMESSSQ
jgi:hypothetical protein